MTKLRMRTTKPKHSAGPADRLPRRLRPLIALAVYFLVFTLCSPSYPASDQTLQKTITYHLDGAISPSEAGTVIALKRGYFDREGLSVRIIEGGVDRRPAAFVSDNPKAIGVASVFEFLRARAAGRHIVAFASAYTRNPIVFYVRRDSNIRSVSDFAKKTVAYEAGDPTAIIFDALLAKNQISKSAIKEVIGLRTVTALVSRVIDILPGYVGNESLLLNQMREPFNQISPDAFGLHLPGSVYFTNEDTLRSDSESIRKFLRAQIRGWNTVYRKHKADLDTIAETLGIADVDTLTYSLDQQRPLRRPSGTRFGELDPIYLKDAVSVLIQQRLIVNRPRLSEAINLDILRDIYRAEPEGAIAN